MEIVNYFAYLYAIKKNNCQTGKSRIGTTKRKPKTKIELILKGASKKKKKTIQPSVFGLQIKKPMGLSVLFKSISKSKALFG